MRDIKFRGYPTAHVKKYPARLPLSQRIRLNQRNWQLTMLSLMTC